MNEDRENLMRTGTGFIVVAGSVWLLSVFAYVLVQSGIVSKEVPLINEFIAFSCGRRPIIPMIIGLFGLSLRGVASMMK